MHKRFVLKFSSPNGKFNVVIEDDGRVGYAYLQEQENIIGDVWLYNRGESPEEPEWDNPELMPFANAKGYVSEDAKVLPESEKDIEVRWTSEPVIATIYLNGIKHAVLSPGDKPGYSRLAKKDGPLARMLVEG